ncbi:FkbM family methyltransferase [Ancylobacter oerskovii]|uniref:FkbM family methyltransferase n=1 Tax=Ancylobacter oerskovii TaxID=459519 RepID=A0ABW4YY60_9HYPH|nr:FkbM family methyltransferase [Ancylobacter oerskovii]MBS7541738.1 FkbM family methyltransferase [Ancylobacter oerskovii]
MPAVLGPEDIADILHRYFERGERSPDIVLDTMPRSDVSPSVVDELLARPDVHDDDYLVFRHLTAPRTTILDVGANFGYSATSIWRAGSKAAVVSFEPIPMYARVLEALAERINPPPGGLLHRWRHPKRYESFSTGISDRAGTITFHLSVLNGDRINSALTTASTRVDIESYVRNTLFFAEANGFEITSFRLHPFTAPVTTLDQWAADAPSTLKRRKIVAIKIDTEGYEGHTMVGAAKLLHQHRPLVMAECGHAIPLAVETMKQHGYAMLRRSGDRLEIAEAPSGVNTFYGHPSQFRHYRDIGLMS